jgi:hypothetical protein
MQKERNFRTSFKILKLKSFILTVLLKFVPNETIYFKIEKLSDEALQLSFAKSNPYASKFYDLHEAMTSLSRQKNNQCAA